MGGMAMFAGHHIYLHAKSSALVQYARTRIAMLRALRITMTPCFESRQSHSVPSSKFLGTSEGFIRRLKRLDIYHNRDYFRFTRGRFVSNETFEMSRRYVHFDMQELARLAAEAVESESCVSIEKYPDGMYNKAFLLTMDDGAQVVAKVPNPNAGRPHFTTASEVATMEFVCNTRLFRK